jgi:hypothetical protein
VVSPLGFGGGCVADTPGDRLVSQPGGCQKRTDGATNEPVPKKISLDFLLIPGQPGDHYHVSPLTRCKTRACNFTHVILAPGK